MSPQPVTGNAKPSQKQLDESQTCFHPNCFAGKSLQEGGLGVDFRFQSDGTLRGLFFCDDRFEGYPGVIHGGIVSTALDAAMTNCLFSHGIRAMTAELKIRFHESVVSGQSAVIEARLEATRGPLHRLRAELRQRGDLRVTATAKFMTVGESTDT